MIKLWSRSILQAGVCLLTSICGAEMVPFIIPADLPTSSPLACRYAPIEPASPRIAVDRGTFAREGKRIKLWGVNTTFSGNLPDPENASRIAARMAWSGINSVRIHHLDTQNFPSGIWSKDGKRIEPEALQRLDKFIAELAAHGIFVDLNLHVGRSHSKYLGLPPPNTNYDKIVGIFTPQLIQAQKDFARELLQHINPHRGVRYAEDPAIAIVEITNENSFFMWDGEEKLRTLPEYYGGILRKQFNIWLKRKFGTTNALRDAWNKGALPLGSNALRNGDFTSSVSQDGKLPKWQLEEHEGTKAAVTVVDHDGETFAQIKIEKSVPTEWHLQFKQTGLSVEGGKYYTVLLRASAESTRTITCAIAMDHSPWTWLGLSRTFEIGPTPHDFSFGFTATQTDNKGKISFHVGGNAHHVYLGNVQLRPGGRNGLLPHEEIGTVALFGDAESSPRESDHLLFLAETEKSYFDDMRSYIRSLGCKALVTGTIVFGPLGLWTQSDMDFIDSHSYWQHPNFPGRPWDMINWTVQQKAMVDHPEESTFVRIACERLEGKPFTVSEYNHPAPNDFQAECVPMLSAFAALQDWDGLWLFDYGNSAKEDAPERFRSFFDIEQNPSKWGFVRAGTALFREGGIVPLNKLVVGGIARETLLSDLVEARKKGGDSMLSLVNNMENATTASLFNAISFGFGKASSSRLFSNHPATFKWADGSYTAKGPKGWVAVGNSEAIQIATEGRVSVSNPSFAAISLCALDESSNTLLLTACGKCENTGMTFSADRTTVGKNWGTAPVQIEAVDAVVSLPQGKWACTAHRPDGDVKIAVTDKLHISPDSKTMWYLLERLK